MTAPATPGGGSVIETATLTGRERYQLLTSLLVPRPIGWVSSRAGGVANLAPFSYYMAIAATPMLVGISIGLRRGQPKDTLRNIRESGVFCLNVVSDALLEAMNATAAEHAHGVDEFETAGLASAEAQTVDAPYVAACPAVFECRLFREVELGDAPSVLIIGEVTAVRIGSELSLTPGTFLVEPETLLPVARLGGDLYSRQGEVVRLARPVVD